VGKNIDWDALDEYPSNPLFIKLNKFFDLKPIGGAYSLKRWLLLGLN
jgi:hypothetical protein